MKINIRTKNIELIPSLRDFINKKIGSLEKFLKSVRSPVEAFVEIEKTTHHHRKGPYFRAECQLEVEGRNVRAEARGEDLRVAITEVKDEIQREVKTFKGKITDVSRKRQRVIKKILRIASGAWFRKK